MPKALIDINGEPFILHQLRLLARKGIRRALLCVGHLGEQIVQRVGNSSIEDGQSRIEDRASFVSILDPRSSILDLRYLEIEYSFDGPRLLGTAGAIKKALAKIEGQVFFVLYGDSYLDCDYAAIRRAFQNSGKLALMTVFRNDGRWDASNVEFKGGRILAYDKKKPADRMQHIDYGLGVFHKEAFAKVPADDPYDLATLYQQLFQTDQLAAFEVTQRFYEIGSLAGLEETRRYLAEHAKG